MSARVCRYERARMSALPVCCGDSAAVHARVRGGTPRYPRRAFARRRCLYSPLPIIFLLSSLILFTLPSRHAYASFALMPMMPDYRRCR